MIEFGGIIYYLDLDNFEKSISLNGSNPKEPVTVSEVKTIIDDKKKIVGTEKTETISERGREIDATKYDLIRLMIEVLIDNNEESDETLGVDRALEKTPLSYKIAFNTLYNCGVLKEKE